MSALPELYGIANGSMEFCFSVSWRFTPGVASFGANR